MSQVTSTLRSTLREINRQNAPQHAAPLRRYLVDLYRNNATVDGDKLREVRVDALDYLAMLRNHNEYKRLFELYYPSDSTENKKIVQSAAKRVGLQAPIEYDPENPTANDPNVYNAARRSHKADQDSAATLEPLRDPK
ncbi:hypothetical protein SARC_03428 [Sphaeroforma arctica JP610]|uniref:Uncharacterized protein n=1 Tax=Sphaeroforma arctica JP610 TaxID=667725 RepID=A0A0L0G7X8_9EUKA|nr:hypothetical protein SARC_03428 [Sphaeroforma arctica JP610]KNC84348.1 hypothetical protein SARC_03428 [Sphaeroforma arctica JP610]|eukprot:XP_014158250.1 hypothetical protein SARC_03428 [Sphaeroforma arctica JP610]